MYTYIYTLLAHSWHIKKMTQNAIRWYDFTIHDYNDTDITDIITPKLNQLCEKWVFQEEKAPTTNKLHLQGRMQLFAKTRLNTCIKQFRGWHLSPTCKLNQNKFDYVTKSETKVRGPWRWDEEVTFIPDQVKEIVKLYPWQQKIVDSSNKPHPREINMIIDKKGGIGKSTFGIYLKIKKLGHRCPRLKTAQDASRMVYCLPTSKLYVFDFPRANPKFDEAEFWASIEEIKNGYAYDDRHKFRDRVFNRPSVWIFSNSAPKSMRYLSADKWKFWKVQNNDLVEFHPFEPVEPELSVNWDNDFDSTFIMYELCAYIESHEKYKDFEDKFIKNLNTFNVDNDIFEQELNELIL